MPRKADARTFGQDLMRGEHVVGGAKQTASGSGLAIGITTYLSLSARQARGDDEGALRRQIVRRAALIFLFGFLMNGFPFFTWGDVSGVAHPTFVERIVDRLYHWLLESRGARAPQTMAANGGLRAVLTH